MNTEKKALELMRSITLQTHIEKTIESCLIFFILNNIPLTMFLPNCLK